MAIDPMIIFATLNKKIAALQREVDELEKATVWLGVTSTQLTDGASTNPIVVYGRTILAKNGNMAGYGDSEFIYNGSIWQEFGSASGAQSDWDETNSSSAAFVRNRTHYDDTQYGADPYISESTATATTIGESISYHGVTYYRVCNRTIASIEQGHPTGHTGREYWLGPISGYKVIFKDKEWRGHTVNLDPVGQTAYRRIYIPEYGIIIQSAYGYFSQGDEASTFEVFAVEGTTAGTIKIYRQTTDDDLKKLNRRFLDMDDTPTQWSEKPVESGGVYDTISAARSALESSIAGIGNGIHYAVCSTSASEDVKEITLSEISELTSGLNVRVLFTYGHRANSAAYLQINSGPFKIIKRSGYDSTAQYEWDDGELLDLVYDGNSWIITDGGLAHGNYPGRVKLTNGYDGTAENLALSQKGGADVIRLITGAQPYDATATYGGEGFEVRVIYGRSLYKLKKQYEEAAIGPEAWTPSHWEVLYNVYSTFTTKDELSKAFKETPGVPIFTTCSSDADAEYKEIFLGTHRPELYEGMSLRILFYNEQTFDGSVYLYIYDSSDQEPDENNSIEIKRSAWVSTGQNEWVDGEVIDLVYDGQFWLIVNHKPISE